MTAMNSGSLTRAFGLPRSFPAEPLEVRGRGGHALLADLDLFIDGETQSTFSECSTRHFPNEGCDGLFAIRGAKNRALSHRQGGGDSTRGPRLARSRFARHFPEKGENRFALATSAALPKGDLGRVSSQLALGASGSPPLSPEQRRGDHHHPVVARVSKASFADDDGEECRFGVRVAPFADILSRRRLRLRAPSSIFASLSLTSMPAHLPSYSMIE